MPRLARRLPSPSRLPMSRVLELQALIEKLKDEHEAELEHTRVNHGVQLTSRLNELVDQQQNLIASLKQSHAVEQERSIADAMKAQDAHMATRLRVAMMTAQSEHQELLDTAISAIREEPLRAAI